MIGHALRKSVSGKLLASRQLVSGKQRAVKKECPNNCCGGCATVCCGTLDFCRCGTDGSILSTVKQTCDDVYELSVSETWHLGIVYDDTNPSFVHRTDDITFTANSFQRWRYGRKLQSNRCVVNVTPECLSVSGSSNTHRVYFKQTPVGTESFTTDDPKTLTACESLDGMSFSSPNGGINSVYGLSDGFVNVGVDDLVFTAPCQVNARIGTLAFPFYDTHDPENCLWGICPTRRPRSYTKATPFVSGDQYSASLLVETSIPEATQVCYGEGNLSTPCVFNVDHSRITQITLSLSATVLWTKAPLQACTNGFVEVPGDGVLSSADFIGG